MPKLIEPAAIPGVRVYGEGHQPDPLIQVKAYAGHMYSMTDPEDSPQPPLEADDNEGIESPAPTIPDEEPDDEDDDFDDEEDEEEDDEDE